MLFFGILSILLLTVSADNTVRSSSYKNTSPRAQNTSPDAEDTSPNTVNQYCNVAMQRVCDVEHPQDTAIIREPCNAKFGTINTENIKSKIQGYVNANIEKSFTYLLMSTHFGNYYESRDGLKGLYRKLSDKSWNDAIDLSKYLSQRGIDTNFGVNPDCEVKMNNYDLPEVESLSKALDHQKELATHALNIHYQAVNKEQTIGTYRVNDAGLAHYLVEQFVEPLTESIRQLSGYTNDLAKMLAKSSNANGLSIFLFDEYIKSTL